MNFYFPSLKQALTRVVVISALFVTAWSQQPVHKIRDLKPTVLLVSLDGFRADYLDRGITPNLAKIAREGVRSEWMQPVFPTDTFPNHFTIVTGLYPEQHGIVGNEFWDPERQQQFAYNKAVANDPVWWRAEPIWSTAEKQGIRAATLFWPGSDVAIQGTRPTYWTKYLHTMPNDERVQRVLAWLDKPVAQRPQMLTLYFSTLDTAGHDFGPDSDELAAALRQVDATIGLLWQGLRARGVEKRINVIFVSDHGMATTTPEQTVFLEDYADPATIRVGSWGQLFAAEALNGNNDALLAALQRAPHVNVYKKCEIAERSHYCHSPRIAPVLALAEEGWELTTRKKNAARTAPKRGSHGYDNELPSMRALFVATGPALKRGQRMPAFANIQVYALMCHLLGIKPQPNEGDLRVFRAVLAGTRVRDQRAARVSH